MNVRQLWWWWFQKIAWAHVKIFERPIVALIAAIAATVVTIMPWRKRFVTQVYEEGGENDDDGDDGDDHSDHNGGDDEESGDDNALKEKVWVSKFYEEKFCSVDGRGGRCSYTRISLREDAGWLRWDEFSFFAMKVPLAQRLRWVFYLA